VLVSAAVEVDEPRGYSLIKAVNFSSLKYLAVSPKLYRYRLTHPEPQKPAFTFGGAFHTLVLEPERFDERYAVYDGRRIGKEWDAWRAEHEGVEALKPDELVAVHAMADAVRSHRVARKLLIGGRREEIVVWTDEPTGLACKGRLDMLRPDFLIDLKSAHDPTPDAFQRAAFNNGAITQVAFYQDGAVAARLLDGRINPYVIAVEKDPPYDVAVYQLDDEALAVGRSIYRRLMDRLLQCIEADHWPGCAPDVQTLSAPRWAVDKTLRADNESEDF
jgi:hypothetical protein